ncbi:MAG: hypothetical protein WKG01_04890 [Kofleriaceae bacterium]
MMLRLSLMGFMAIACTRPNPRLCQNGACSDPQYPFCDVDGSLSGEPLTCISVSCTPLELAGCRGDVAIECNELGNDYNLLQCEQGCDAASGCLESSARVRLTYQVALTDSIGRPDPTPVDAAIPGVIVRVGRVDGALSPATYQADGSVPIPRDYPGTPWRLEYTIDGEPPQEVQWISPVEGGHVVEPMFGRLDRGEVPLRSGYSVTLTGPGGLPPYKAPRLFTTGVWTNTALPASPVSPIEIPFSAVKPISGKLGQPDATRGDTGILVDYETDGACEVTRGTSELMPPQLKAGELTAVSAPWRNVSNTSVAFDYVGVEEQKLTEALGSRAGIKSSRVYTGFTPHNAMPVLLQDHLQAGVPSPPMIPVADCVFGITDPSTFADPAGLTVFPRLAFGRYGETRTLSGGPSLTSSVSAAAISSSETFTLDFDIPLAEAPITLDGDAGARADLAGSADGVTMPSALDRLTLRFTLGTSPTVADYTRVILYRLDGTSLQTVRVFTLVDPDQRELVVDRSVLTSGEFVFAIETHRGRPRISVGDFAAVRYPQVASRVFTRSFVVP